MSNMSKLAVIKRDKYNNLHCDDGPAVVWPGGSMEWFCHGAKHREDGPALITASGKRQYWLNGEFITDVPVVWFLMGRQNNS